MSLSVIHTYAEEFKNYESLYNAFLRQIEDSNSPALINMGHTSPSGLAYIVKTNQRWTKATGELAFLINDNSGMIVGISGVEHSTLSDKLGSGGNRCWVLPEFRTHNEVTNYLLSANLDWCKEHGKAGMLLTFNEYNKWIYDTIAKLSAGKGAAFGRVWSDWWSDCIVLPRMISLFDTPQWAVVKPIADVDVVKDIIADVDRIYGIAQ